MVDWLTEDAGKSVGQPDDEDNTTSDDVLSDRNSISSLQVW